MNDILNAALLGVVEGLTEFLPVSSTAHLRITQALLGMRLDDEYWKMFSIFIQLGAILAVVVYFRTRLIALLKTFRFQLKHPLSLVLIAFVVTAIPAFLMSKLIGKHLENTFMIGGALFVGGIAMWVIDRSFSKGTTNELGKVTVKQSVWVGVVQILSAVFPGTSRSMSTIAGGQIVGMTRATALEFSFFLSIPTMVAATGYDLLKTIMHSHDGTEPVVMGMHEWIVLAVGFVVSFFVAWLVIAWFMNWVRTKGFMIFAIYRIIVGATVLWAASASRFG